MNVVRFLNHLFMLVRLKVAYIMVQLHMNLVNMIMVVQDRFATIIMVLDGGVLVMMKVFIVQVTLQFAICLNAGILIVMNY